MVFYSGRLGQTNPVNRELGFPRGEQTEPGGDGPDRDRAGTLASVSLVSPRVRWGRLAGGRRLRLLLTWLLLWPRQTRFPVLQKNQERWDRPERKAWQPSAARNANLTLICFSTDDEKRDRKAAARSPRTDLIQAKYLKYTRPGKPGLADAHLRNAQKYKELGSLGRPLPSPVHVAPVTGPS